MDDPADLRRSLYMMYDVPPEQRYVVVGQSLHFLLTEYSHYTSHGISPLAIGRDMEMTKKRDGRTNASDAC